MKKITFLLIVLLTPLFAMAQFPESFNNSVPPPGWTIFTGANGLGINSNWREWSQEARLDPEDVSGGNAQDWLVTPQFTPTGSANVLQFLQKQTNSAFLGSIYTIRVSTNSQTSHSDFVVVDTQNEGGFGTSYSEHTVDLSAYNGIPIYLAFVMEQDNGDSWYVDEVDIIAPTTTITNPFPESFNSSVPPAGWTIFTGANGLGTNSNWREWSQEARLDPEDVSGGNAQDWLVTPQFTPTGSANVLQFLQKQTNSAFLGSIYTIRVSTNSQTSHSDFVVVDTQNEGGFGTSYSEHTVDLSAYNGIPIYLAFVMEQDNGDSWYVDEVDIVAPTTTIINPFPESFNSSVPPAGWTIFTGANGLGTNSNWREWSQEARLDPEDVSGGNAQDWLVTPMFTPTGSANVLQFLQKQTNSAFLGSVYTIRVSTNSQTSHSDFVIVDTQSEGGFGTSYSEHTVDLSAYNGIPIYLAFVMEQDNGDSWYVDEVDIVASTGTTNPFPEDFEDTVPPSNWITFRGTNGEGTNSDWTSTNVVASGSQAAYVEFEDVSNSAQDWIVTPQFTPSPTSNVLSFYQRQSYPTDYSTVYTVRVSTASQTDHDDFNVIVDTQSENDLSLTYEEHFVDLSAYDGIPIYVAFVMEQDDGDDWYIDDVDLIQAPNAPECARLPNPDDGATNVDIPFDKEVFVFWQRSQTGFIPQGYEVFLGTDPNNLVSIDIVEINGINLLNLENGQTYYWKVVPYNSTGSATGCPTWSFTVEDEHPIFTPFYDQSFETSPQYWLTADNGPYGSPSGNQSGNMSLSNFANDINNSLGVKVTLWRGNSHLITPRFDLTGGNHTLSFNIALTEWLGTSSATLGANDYIALLATDNEGSTWTEVSRWDSTTSISNTGQSEEFQLIGYGDEVRFVFYTYGDDLIDIFDFFIDDFVISDATASINNEIITNLSVFPTLVKNDLNINADEKIDQISIYNLLGQQVFTSTPKLLSNSIDLSSFQSGIYLVRISTGSQSATYKIVKQ